MVWSCVFTGFAAGSFFFLVQASRSLFSTSAVAEEAVSSLLPLTQPSPPSTSVPAAAVASPAPVVASPAPAVASPAPDQLPPNDDDFQCDSCVSGGCIGHDEDDDEIEEKKVCGFLYSRVLLDPFSQRFFVMVLRLNPTPVPQLLLQAWLLRHRLSLLRCVPSSSSVLFSRVGEDSFFLCSFQALLEQLLPHFTRKLTKPEQEHVLKCVGKEKLQELLFEVQGNYDCTKVPLYRQCLDAASKSTTEAEFRTAFQPLVEASGWPLELKVVKGDSDEVRVVVLDCRRGRRPSTTDADVPIEVRVFIYTRKPLRLLIMLSAECRSRPRLTVG